MTVCTGKDVGTVEPPPGDGWLDRAACRGEGFARFFAAQPSGETLAICAGCEVRFDCLDFAVKNGIEDGVWGGVPAERRPGTRASKRRRNPVYRNRGVSA